MPVVSHDFDRSECFQVGQTYRIEPRTPSSPGVPQGLSLTRDAVHFGWIRERSRRLIAPLLTGGRTVQLTVTARGKRWSKWDNRLAVEREWQEGIGYCEAIPTAPEATETE